MQDMSNIKFTVSVADMALYTREKRVLFW